MLHGCLKSLKCLMCFKCLKCADEEYIQQLARTRNRSMASTYSTVNNNSSATLHDGIRSRGTESSLGRVRMDSLIVLHPSNADLPGLKSENNIKKLPRNATNRKSSKSSDSIKSFVMQSCCSFLFSSHKNDFYQTSARRRSSMHSSSNFSSSISKRFSSSLLRKLRDMKRNPNTIIEEATLSNEIEKIDRIPKKVQLSIQSNDENNNNHHNHEEPTIPVEVDELLSDEEHLRANREQARVIFSHELVSNEETASQTDDQIK
jgi:hypothetical protein